MRTILTVALNLLCHRPSTRSILAACRKSNKVIGNPNTVYFGNYELTRSEMLKEKL